MRLGSNLVAVFAALALLGGSVALAQELVPQPEDPEAPEALEAEVEPAQEEPESEPEPEPQPIPAAVPAAAPREEERDERVRRFALGVGAGLVNAGPTTEPYFMASLRMQFGQQDGREEDRDDERRDVRRDTRGDQRRDGREGLGGYLEPEIGYWERSALGVSESDLMVGVNIGGLVMLRSISYFVAAGVGVHFIDVDRFDVQDDSTSLGVNVQFGVDVHLSPSFSVFGVGRVDLVDEWDDETQAKIYLGLRGHF